MTSFNDADILIDGDETFASIFEGIKKAKSYVLVQFYIIRDDEVGKELKDLLIERSRQEVKCRLLYDEIGSKLPKSSLSDLRENGVENGFGLPRPTSSRTSNSSVP